MGWGQSQYILFLSLYIYLNKCSRSGPQGFAGAFRALQLSSFSELRGHWALENTEKTRENAARSRLCARKGCSSLLRSRQCARKGCSSLLRSRQCARKGCSSLLRRRQCARKGCSSLLRSRQCARKGCSSLLRSCQCAQKGCSSLLRRRQCVRKGCSSLLFKITIRKCWTRRHGALHLFAQLSLLRAWICTGPH